MIPTFILCMWLLGLLSAAFIVGAIYLGREWYSRSWMWDETLRQSIFAPDYGWNAPTALLAGAVVLGLIACLGRPILKLIVKLMRKSGDDPRQAAQVPAHEQRIRRPDGSELLVKSYGPLEAPPLVMTHGWGLNSDEWFHAHRELAGDFRLIVWDEPGLGGSKGPDNNDFSLEKLANDLRAVLEVAGSQPTVLIGHSIGGMIILTFCRLFPQDLGSRVSGLVLTHTTHTNPVRTTSGAAFFTAIEKPILVPLMYLTIGLSPLIRLMNIMSYLNGSSHVMNMLSSFAGTESWEQIDFGAHFQAKASPGVLARGMLGMMRYDATATLKTIALPTLVVAGDRDNTCKPEASERMHREILGADKITLTPARHLGLIEHHARYAEAVRKLAKAEALANAA
ncbi:MAG TPA: alpha/beta hydrolase [Chthoniobacterales bacterium]